MLCTGVEALVPQGCQHEAASIYVTLLTVSEETVLAFDSSRSLI